MDRQGNGFGKWREHTPNFRSLLNLPHGVRDEDGKEIEILVPELRGPLGDQVGPTIDLIMVVVDEDRRLRRKGDVRRADLVKEVYVSLDGSRKQAERWVRSAIERGEIDDFPRD